MIAKRTRHRQDGGSSYRALATYIRDAKAGVSKARDVRVTNCHNPEPDLAVREIEATQSRNTRMQSDKSYHLVVSFPAGEQPSAEQLRDI
jgi:Relaxase/Mobilisation nuclease domain